MSKFFITVFCSLILSAHCFAQTNPASDAPSSNLDAVDEILIIGEQPGPSLWRVYKGDNVLWILGTFGPLPKKLQWRSKQAEDAIINSQEVFMPPGAHAKIGFFSQLALLPSVIGLKKSPDGLTLEEKVPADVYERWLSLKEKYIGKDKAVEKYRPIFAGHELLETAQKKAGFDDEDMIVKRVQELAKKHKIKVTTPTYEFTVEAPRQTLKRFKQTEMDDVPCFTKMVDHLAKDLNNMRLRANAWATGDLAALADLPITDPGSECWDAFMKSSFAEQEGMKDLPAKVEAEWYARIDEALTNNTSSFALVPTLEMLKKDNVMAKLQAKGYRIEGFGFDALKPD
ncbi:GumN protein [Cellvibrio zantedeschiae]|uniref:GumN protein n=1 Tax=Cellvibrio zantedeschiae TaxID=1237077 RepID=A0ABQ3BBX2_9GAMM|nr:TraB/GumN family protein [Cellvibrio zantedeschiae]GGY83323.1 GumN protein [Cellvibrio zantedeschiae]